MAWTKDMFGVEKPIIALLHLRALPGDPLYAGDVEQVFRQAREDLIALQDGGVDGVLIANEFSLPYQPQAEPVTVGAMGYLVGRLKENIRVPFGVNVVLNPMASLELAASTGAHFIRSAFTGTYMGENGVVTTDVATTVRRKKALGLDHLKMFYKVNPESDAKTAVEKLSHSDGACVGTTFKKDGKFENNVDPDRVVEFMNIVKEFRKTLV